MKKSALLALLPSLLMMLPAPAFAQSSAPVLLFSDLTWGPNSGWEGSAAKGAAVTIWGEHFGSARGSSYVTVNGAQITNYAEWGATGPARGLERITFWLNSNCQAGSGTITVTVNGVTSNALSFNVVSGASTKIYFISVSEGSNSYNGLFSTRAGHSGADGPFRDIYKFNPADNPSGDGQYIVYVREGTYSAFDPCGDPPDSFICMRGPYGSPEKQKALIGYPAEAPVINTTNAGHGITWIADYSPYGHVDYYTISKLENVGGTTPYGTFGNHVRYAGNWIKDCLDNDWSGLIWVGGSQDVHIYGNYFEHNGFDSYKHNIYIKSQPAIPAIDQGSQYVYVGWNEIADPVSGTDNRGGAIFISESSDSLHHTGNIYIHDNYFHGGNEEFIYTGDGAGLFGIYIYNNIFTGGTEGSGAVFLAANTRSAYVYNNIFSNTHPGLPLVAVTGATSAVTRNNIFDALSGQEAFAIETYMGATIDSGYDLFYGSGIPSGGGITVANARTGNPIFLDAGAADFHLQAGSPAIDAGTSAVSGNVTADYDGVPRPQGSGYDIGAYEHPSGPCIPDCAGKQCGNDGCGGSCGSCPGTDICNAQGQCIADATPPVCSAGSPSGTLPAGTSSATLLLTTDEPATCRYSIASGTAYSSMVNTFSVTGGTAHSAAVSGLQNGISYSYYVRCQDGAGNPDMNDFTISFSVGSSASTCPVKADTVPCEGCVNGTELGTFISRWHVSNLDVSIKDLMEAIGRWKSGTGCGASGGACMEGQITYTCTCQGAARSSGYCCSNEYETLGPCCANGAIPPSGCYCSAQYGMRYSDYCCNNEWISTAC